MLVVIWGCPITMMNTSQSVTDRHIGAIINIWIYMYIYMKIHTSMEGLVMTWNIYIRFKVILRPSIFGLGSGEGFTEIVCIESLLGLSDN